MLTLRNWFLVASVREMWNIRKSLTGRLGGGFRAWNPRRTLRGGQLMTISIVCKGLPYVEMIPSGGILCLVILGNDWVIENLSVIYYLNIAGGI